MTDESSSELASKWFKDNQEHIEPSRAVLHHLLKYYESEKPVKWRRESPVKAVLGPNRKEGRISITPHSKRKIRLRFAPLEPSEQVTTFVESLHETHKDFLDFKVKNEKTIDITSNFEDESLRRLLLVTDLILVEFDFSYFSKPISFNFSPEITEKAQSNRKKVATFQDFVLKEAQMEKRFVTWLKIAHGIEAISQDTDGPFRRDVVYQHKDCRILAELKYTSSARENIEQAIGQLLRYKLHPAAKKDADKLLIVSGGSRPSSDDIEWFCRLRNVLDLNIGMLYEDPTYNGKFCDIDKQNAH